MAKFFGLIGYVVSTETAPGVWTDVSSEHEYIGDTLRESKQWQKSENLNDNLTIQNRVSIVADNFAYEHFSSMKYVLLYGVRWNIISVEVVRPRMILSLGGVYNG